MANIMRSPKLTIVVCGLLGPLLLIDGVLNIKDVVIATTRHPFWLEWFTWTIVIFEFFLGGLCLVAVTRLIKRSKGVKNGKD